MSQCQSMMTAKGSHSLPDGTTHAKRTTNGSSLTGPTRSHAVGRRNAHYGRKARSARPDPELTSDASKFRILGFIAGPLLAFPVNCHVWRPAVVYMLLLSRCGLETFLHTMV